MKKVLTSILILSAVFFCLLAAPTVYAQSQHHVANQVTIGWDAVSAPQPTDRIKYNVYTKNTLGSGTAVLATEKPIVTTQALLTFPKEGKFLVGVSTVREVMDADTVISTTESVIGWSDDRLIVAGGEPGTFDIWYFVPADVPAGLRKIE